ncbi:hypothetical protein [Microbacterium trichothecenolyticum]|uniref:HTH marR-type domain-containing protein n=1 Tax=Microbacterium trichothecenolyticum TaxID=69370 RepID=A0ABU0TYU3_MICTR|nr:hypothetical protein [Microbacterium trichothecenolyticum]MDQ1124127.1 hypothetical protein [Microbacterium trichothecenolyticum]
MTTSTPLDARSLAHRLTTVGHALHHRLFTQLRESVHSPKTVLMLSVIDGRIDAPWARERLSRGGKRLTELAERGMIARTDDIWTLTDRGRAILDAVDADRSALLSEIPADDLSRLSAALDALADTLGIDESAPLPRRGFRRAPGHGHGRDARARFDERGGRCRGAETDHRRAHRAAQRAYERGFDAGFSRGRESSASA